MSVKIFAWHQYQFSTDKLGLKQTNNKIRENPCHPWSIKLYFRTIQPIKQYLVDNR